MSESIKGGAAAAGPRRLVLVITEDWYYWSHRRALALGALAQGWSVTLVSRFGELRAAIAEDGVATADLPFARRGRNPLAETFAIARLAALYRRLRPDVVHHVAIKPVLYGSLAARLARLPAVVNAISGLGYVFTAPGIKPAVLRQFAGAGYRTALRRDHTVTIFQNEDDRGAFVAAGLVRRADTALIRGSGVDLERFRPVERSRDVPVVLHAGRLLWSKGVGDIVEAARRLRARGVAFRLELVGRPDDDNPESVPEQALRGWEAEGLANWRGRQSDMPAVLAGADVVVLASQREGVPKILLEAAGAGLPAVATDVPGCRDVVAHGRNGFLVSPGDPEAIADALEALLADPTLRRRMGEAARERAEREFDERLVVAQTLALYDRAAARA